MGSYWLNNFVYALFTSMPDLVINVRPETLPIPFDLVTLNYVLPGMADHYGWVNRNMSMTCRITQLYINKYMPEINQVEIWGSMTVKLWLRGGNLDGTDQLAVEWNITHAFVNGTLKEATAPYFPEDQPRMTLLITEIRPMEVVTTYSSFGYVNDLLIQQALNVYMQNNANLFQIAVAATQKQVSMTIGNKFKHFYSKDDWDFIVMEDCVNVGLTPDWAPFQAAIGELFGDEWYYPGEEPIEE